MLLLKPLGGKPEVAKNTLTIMKHSENFRFGAALAVAALSIASTIALAVQNMSLRADLRDSANAVRQSGGSGSIAPTVGEGRAVAPGEVAAETGPNGGGDPGHAGADGTPAAAIPGGAIDREAFDKAVSGRVEALERERNEEREAHRRKWENATEEEREARRKEFRAGMRKFAAEQLDKFEKNTKLDLDQCAALEMELDVFDARVREIAERFAVMIDGGKKLDFEMQIRIMNEMSEAALETYDGIDEVLPEDWRENAGEFNVMFGLDPTSFSPIFDAMRRTGAMPDNDPFLGGFDRPPPRR